MLRCVVSVSSASVMPLASMHVPQPPSSQPRFVIAPGHMLDVVVPGRYALGVLRGRHAVAGQEDFNAGAFPPAKHSGQARALVNPGIAMAA